MARLPVVSDRQAVRALERAGWEHVRTKGDHMILVKSGVRANLSVPDHPELYRGTLRRLIALAGIDVQEFSESLRK